MNDPLPEPDLVEIAEIMRRLLMVWNDGIAQNSSASVLDSWMSDHQRIGHRLEWSETTIDMPRAIMFFVSLNVTQMMHTLCSLYASHRTYPLTVGHMPTMRTLFEGIGQVAWLMSNDDDLYTTQPTTLTAEESEWRCRRRTARAYLCAAANWTQYAADGRMQGEPEMETQAADALDRLYAASAELGVKVDRDDKKVWGIDGQRRLSSREFAARGWQAALWPNKSDHHGYGFMCAVSHNNIYPIIEGLDPTIASGNLVLRATRPIDDLFADGWFAALGYSRLIELVFTLVGWSLTGALAVRSLIEAAQQNAQTYADAMEALDVDGGEPNATD